MPTTAFGLTDTGQGRSSNEDAYGLFEDLHLYIVADGMGGHAAGEVASRMAVDAVQDYMASAENQKKVATFPDIPQDLPPLAQRLVAAGKSANQKIHQLGQTERRYNGMGTTMVSFVVNGNTTYIAHAGDSRAYLIRNGTIKQITDDHSLINEYIRQGLLTHEDAAIHPLKHVITRALGTSPQIDFDVNIISLIDGDFLLLCSDGLSNPLSDQDILKQVVDSRTHLKDGCSHLIRMALDKGADDNITVILFSYSK
jgi:PPM family protein phosphatase